MKLRSLLFAIILCNVNVFGQRYPDTFFTKTDDLKLDCDIKTSINATKINNLLLSCANHELNYGQYLKDLNIGPINILQIVLKMAPNVTDLVLKSSQFLGLDARNLILDYEFRNKSVEELIKFDGDVIFAIEKVKSLELSGVIVTPLKDNTTTGQCNLESIKIQISNLKFVSHGWLKRCIYLSYLRIFKFRQRNGTKEIRRKVFAGLNNLRQLVINECYIEELNDELEDLVNLQKLDVSHNQIHYALTTTVLPSLEEWDLSNNHLFSSSLLATALEKQPRLRYVNLDYNRMLDLCNTLNYRTTVDEEAVWHVNLSGRNIRLPNIRRFSIKGSDSSDLCFGGVKMDSLEYFDISDSMISDINFQELPQTKAPRFEINVAGCPITNIPHFKEQEYHNLNHEELRISGLNVTLDCDCDEYFWLARAVRERKLVLNRVFCTTNEDFATVGEERLNCTKYQCYGGICSCRRYWKDNSTDVKCNGELQEIPRLPGLKRLFAAGNLVENITTADLPDSLIYLDLSNNHVARMSAEASVRLFKSREMKTRFIGNPIICDCQNRDFIVELMDHFDQVLDYNLLICANDGRYIRDVRPENLCEVVGKSFVTFMVASAGAMVGLCALIAGLYHRYGQTVKAFLYSRGICLLCIKEEEVDADRPFDAFVSFSHKDLDFVSENLLPGLEKDPYNYNICVHYRNWVAGELIPTQINRSVEESKRTVIVLSKNFLESIWGLLEFRTAHLSALKEGRSRVIIIILDDVLNDENLDNELRNYLRTNTYVEYGDPWFWNKLRYALPHRQNDRVVPPKINRMVSTDSAIEMEQFSSELNLSGPQSGPSNT